MIYGDEDRDGTVLPRHRAGRIGAPHLIQALGRDRASWARGPKTPHQAGG